MSQKTFNQTSGGSGSGNIRKDDGNWNVCRTANIGETTSSDVVANSTHSIADDFTIWRGFLTFDTSSLPDNVTINSAIIDITMDTELNSDNDGRDFVVVVKNTQASPTTLILDDYDEVGTAEGSNRIDMTGKSNQAVTFTLNATGIALISGSSYSQFALREGHDLLNHQIQDITDNRSVFTNATLTVTFVGTTMNYIIA